MEKEQERMILDHEPLPGYRMALYIAVAVGAIYLVIVFGKALI